MVTYNVKLAQILGLHEAIYIGQLLDINKKAIKKGVLEENFLVIDRKYLEDRTTLSEDEQNKIDEKLIEVGLLQKRDNNSLQIDINRLVSIICCEDNIVLEDLSTIFKKATKKSTKDKGKAIVENLKKNINTTNEELREAYSEWIDTVYAKQGWMSKKSVVLAQQIVDDFSNHNLDVALKVIDIATVNGYRDMEWAVTNYTKNFKINLTYPTVPKFAEAIPIKRNDLSEEVF